MVENINPRILEIDFNLHTLVKNIDILDAIKPLNYHEEKMNFFTQKYSQEPQFSYQEHTIDPFLLKRNIFNLPIDDIGDEDLYELYLAVANSYVDKIDQFKSIGTPEFLYDSLRYYGEPSEKDIRNAQFILHLPQEPDEISENYLNTEQIKAVLSKMAEKEGYEYSIKTDDSMIANALVSGTTVKINSLANISETETKALAHHELGVHLVTTLNSRMQALKVLSLGCPINTMTQEGLAILSEYLAGHMTIKRLKILALRVLAVQSMIKEKNFKSTFSMLKDQYQVDDEQAFTITSRVYRGGGFTKDYLYLQGFHLMLNAYENEPDFLNLLTGKTSLEFLPIISQLIKKEIILAPHYITPAFRNPVKNDAVKTYITHAIR